MFALFELNIFHKIYNITFLIPFSKLFNELNGTLENSLKIRYP